MILKIYQNSSNLEPPKEYQRITLLNKEYPLNTLYGAKSRDFKNLKQNYINV